MNDRPIRVLHIMEAVVGGTKKHLIDLCLGLDSRRFRVHAILSPLRDPDPHATKRILADNGIAVEHVPMKRGFSPVSAIRCLPRITRLLEATRPDIVHAHSATAGVLGRIAARRAGVPAVVYTPHGFPFSMEAPYPMRLVSLWAERLLGRYTDRVIAVSASERRTAIDASIVPSYRCVTIHNGITTETPPQVGSAEKCTTLGLPADAKMLLCVGNLRPQKNHALAIDALAQLLPHVPDTHLVIAGEGELETALERRARAAAISDHVHLVGFRNDVPQLLACCDVFVQPSLWEACPYALLEAAAAECPIVAADIAGIRDIITDGVSGWLSRPDDATDLAANLRRALQEPEQAKKRAKSAAELVRSEYRLEEMIGATQKLYLDLVGRLHIPEPSGR